jgi:hypothetical protein
MASKIDPSDPDWLAKLVSRNIAERDDAIVERAEKYAHPTPQENRRQIFCKP